MHTPARRASAALHNAEWQAVLARYAARRMGQAEQELGPQVVAHIAVGAASAAYEQWLRDESADLVQTIREAFRMAQMLPDLERSEERRVGKECVRTCRSRGCAAH